MTLVKNVTLSASLGTIGSRGVLCLRLVALPACTAVFEHVVNLELEKRR
jgi:hypothetical protein